MNAIALTSTPKLLSPRFLALDILRGLAILAIVAYHCLPITHFTLVPFWIDVVTFGGKFGVSLFFVLSGFSIHYTQLRHRGSAQNFEIDRSQWKVFFQRRFWRLYPSYLAALSLAISLNLAWSFIRGRQLIFPSIENVLTHLFLIHTFFTDTFFGIIPALWFIGVQAHLYLLYPIFWEWIRRWKIDQAVLVVLAFTLLSRLFSKAIVPSNSSESLTSVLWTNAPQRWFEWCFGAWVAHQILQNRSLPLSFTILAGFMGGDTFSVFYEPVLGGIIGFIIWGIASLEMKNNRSNIERGLIALGTISYPIYLTHQIFISYIRSALDLADNRFVLQTVLLLFGVLSITIPISILFDRIERRITKQILLK
jgi:peptidoglycan/LPS O-acetylase OafA/YrhL